MSERYLWSEIKMTLVLLLIGIIVRIVPLDIADGRRLASVLHVWLKIEVDLEKVLVNKS